MFCMKAVFVAGTPKKANRKGKEEVDTVPLFAKILITLKPLIRNTGMLLMPMMKRCRALHLTPTPLIPLSLLQMRTK